MDFSTWKARPHFMWEIMTEPRGKSNLQKYTEAKELYLKKQSEYELLENAGKLEGSKAAKLVEQLCKLEETANSLRSIKDAPTVSATCMKRLSMEYTRCTTGKERVINSQEIEKGLFLEEDGITQYSIVTGNYHVKNKVRKENEWASGEIDIEEEERIADTKLSWDIYSFDALRLVGLKKMYEWQGLTYSWIWEKPEARIVHCLLNTPEHLIVNMERKLMYDMFGNEANKLTANDNQIKVYEEACKKIRFNHTYDDLPIERKTKIFTVKRDLDKEMLMAKKVEDCRYILNNFDKIDIYESEET